LRRRRPSVGPRSDRRLADRASKGDRRAIAVIFERYQQELYAFCLGILGEPEDAQDALQNTMVKVLKALPGEEREIALRPWLYRIAHNEAVELRRTRRPIQALDDYLIDGQSSVAERAEQREQLGWLLKDLADLPDRQRAALVMRELNGLDFAEIGAALNTSAAVVRQSLYEARRNLEQIGNGRSLGCDAVTRVLSDADGRIVRRRDIRAHLRDCEDCRRFQDAIEGREGILAAIPPLPAAAAAGVVQAAIGSSSGGVGAALTGGVAKSVCAYGALKAAGTVAAVAVLGTSAIQYEQRSEDPDPSLEQTHIDTRNRSSAPQPEAKAGRSTLHHDRSFVAAAGRSAVASDRKIANRRSATPALEHALPTRVSARPADAVLDGVAPETAIAGDLDADAPPAPRADDPPPPGRHEEKHPDRAPGSKKQPDDAQKAAKHATSGQQPDEQPGRPPKPGKKAAPEHPAKPEKRPEQSKKPAKPEKATPPPALPPPVETEPAAANAEAPSSAAEDTGPNGKAKGHEKHLAS
jgi:RNA polymerase sigma factor (sigma-70 family)